MEKRVYMFDEGEQVEGEKKMILGGKGANLAEMTRMGLPVPFGFIITTTQCKEYLNKKAILDDLWQDVLSALQKLEHKAGKKFGDSKNPLLVSVRSGAPASMPGMMDTILNLGLNDQTVSSLASLTNNERFACDSYRRLMHMYGDVVMGVPHEVFEKTIEGMREREKVKFDSQISVNGLKELVSKYKEIYKKHVGKDFPQDPKEQLKYAVEAVFKSWNTPRAVSYRRINKIPETWGTAVNVQMMVFGNMGEDSGTGVGFTRDPATGENVLYGEFLMNAQGEDVVAGIRTPKHMEEMKKESPQMYEQISKISKTLETHLKDMQDFEFTIEKENLFMLQTRNGKRTAQAAVRIAVEMAKEKLITKKDAVLRVQPSQLDQLLHKQFSSESKKKLGAVAKGLAASPGAAVGKVYFTAEEAVEAAKGGEAVVLVRTETSPEDIEGMNVAKGILTARGGKTSHAAVVARGMGKSCVAGCDDIIVEEEKKIFRIPKKNIEVKEGEWISIDGATGEVFIGKAELVEPSVGGDFKKLLSWADKYRKLKVKANADTPKDSKVARDFGAEGIGLTRTEHMFFEESRIKSFRKMIIADTLEERKKALSEVEPYQQEDFEGIFEVMNGLPVIIRLLDPPLHEFLPHEKEQMEILAKEIGIPVKKIEDTVKSLHELNPMLGFRGCRLAVKYPEIGEMQARAILKAALNCKEKGLDPKPWIEIPIVGHVREYVLVRDLIEKVSEELGAKGKIDYKIGTMIEVPRAAVTADELAKEAEFMSFGTNDLTQMGSGFSRDDAGKFLPIYVEKGIYGEDPFSSIDQDGIGLLMRICVYKARKVKKEIEIGICGEHGGDPASVEFCHRIGMNDVSCSPYRVPIARLAAAQAALKYKHGELLKGFRL